MSKTFRQGKHGYKDDREVNDFWYKHDSKNDRDELNKEFRHDEKQYFEKFGETKYNQKPKSRGWKTQ
jgi:hypothetical protein